MRRSQVLRLSYGGNIGAENVVEGGLNFATLRLELYGADVSGCRFLELHVKGELGGEKPNLYLFDGVHHHSVDLEEYGDIRTTWSVIRVPLDEYRRQGVDLTHLETLEFCFEWEPMSGTIYVDDVAFVTHETRNLSNWRFSSKVGSETASPDPFR